MTKIRKRGEGIRHYIIAQVADHPSDIAKIVGDAFRISRQAVTKHLQRMVEEKILVASGVTRNRTYSLCETSVAEYVYKLDSSFAEDVAWRNDIAQHLGQLPGNVVSIWFYGFTEMLNNALDHSESSSVMVQITKSAAGADMAIYDQGIGIFHKVQTALGLLDERHAVLELAKGKLTTDPARHTGEGIFFTSRMFDQFRIMSGTTYLSHKFGEEEDWVLENREFSPGTWIRLTLENNTARTTAQVFAQFTNDDLGFNKTVVPVALAQYGDDKLVSRSQAKRLLARVERFQTVIFDFEGVEEIGLAFADEIFRVFASQHPKIELLAINSNEFVERVVNRAQIARELQKVGLSLEP